MVKRPLFFSVIFCAALLLSGCGYNQNSFLAGDIKHVHIEPVKNAIDLSGEVTDKQPFRVYRPGIEVDITNAIINRFIFDGNLKVTPAEKADLIIEAKLVDYRREALRYSNSDDIQEYRLSVVLDVAAYRAGTRKVLWHSSSLTGDTSFFLSGSHAVSEDAAAQKAIEDAARRVVDETIEVW